MQIADPSTQSPTTPATPQKVATALPAAPKAPGTGPTDLPTGPTQQAPATPTPPATGDPLTPPPLATNDPLAFSPPSTGLPSGFTLGTGAQYGNAFMGGQQLNGLVNDSSSPTGYSYSFVNGQITPGATQSDWQNIINAENQNYFDQGNPGNPAAGAAIQATYPLNGGIGGTGGVGLPPGYVAPHAPGATAAPPTAPPATGVKSPGGSLSEQSVAPMTLAGGAPAQTAQAQQAAQAAATAAGTPDSAFGGANSPIAQYMFGPDGQVIGMHYGASNAPPGIITPPQLDVGQSAGYTNGVANPSTPYGDPSNPNYANPVLPANQLAQLAQSGSGATLDPSSPMHLAPNTTPTPGNTASDVPPGTSAGTSQGGSTAAASSSPSFMSGLGYTTSPTDPNNALTSQTITPTTTDFMSQAQKLIDANNAASQPQFEANLRDANRYAYANGRGGSGIENTSLGDIVANRSLQQQQMAQQLGYQALGQQNANQYANIGIAQQQQGFQNTQQNQAFNQALQQLLAGSSGDPSQIALILSQIYGSQAGGIGQAAQNYAGQQQANNSSQLQNQQFQQWLQSVLQSGGTGGYDPTTMGIPGIQTTPGSVYTPGQ